MEEFRSIKIDEQKCQGRMACMRVCPTQAIRVRNRKASLLEDRCIDCGECVRVCPNRAIVPKTSSFSDFSNFKYTVAIPSPVLYAHFGKDVLPSTILSALKLIGFDDAHDVTCPSEAVSIAIQEYLDANERPRPFISPFCPTIVRLIQVRYPNLLEHLIPIESPMEIAAREAKREKMKELGLKESEIGAIYLTPCPAKMIAIKSPIRKRHSFINGTIPISDLYPTLLQAIPQVEVNKKSNKQLRGIGLGWPIVGGQASSLKREDCLAIAGLNDVIRIFEEIENGKLKDIQYIECHSCSTACAGGSLNAENPYIIRSKVLRLLEKFGSKPCQPREKIRELYKKKYFSLPGKIPAKPVQPLDNDLHIAIQKMNSKQQFFDTLPKIDCGVCGAPTCLAFAEDVVRGKQTSDDCVFVAIKKFESISSDLLETVNKHSKIIKENTKIN